MFLALILLCGDIYDATTCQAKVSNLIFETQAECEKSVAIGVVVYGNLGFTIGDAECYKWNSPVFDEGI